MLMKKAVLLGVISLAVFLAGCSGGGNNNQVAQTPAPSLANNEQSSIDPKLTQDGFVRVQLTDPALYSYQQKQGLANVSSQTSTISPEEQKKIGRTVSFQKAYKYGIGGSATVVALNKIKVGQFTYNGGCGPIKIGLINNNSQQNSQATVKEIAAAVSSSQFDIEIPSNLSLASFDSLAVFCPDQLDPISVADFSGF